MRSFVLVMDTGDEAVSEVTTFARHNHITAASLTAIGACRAVTLGYFDPQINGYRSNQFTEQLEILSCLGDIATKDDQPVLHAHIVVGRSDSTTLGGHLQHIEIFPTMEVILTETPVQLRKQIDPVTGLALISVNASTA
nr:PPC domain-containing DNA-binding protein [Mycobacterium sp. OAS707]